MMTDAALIAHEEPQAPAVPQNESEALISMIERAARDPDVNIDKMERLFDMHEKMLDRQAAAKFHAAMADAQAEMPTVAKNKDNKQTNSKYADLYAIADVALPVIHKHGFGLSFSQAAASQDGCMGIACTVSHRDGHSREYQFDVPMDGAGFKGNANKTPTHAFGSTFTYGRRYATCGVFNIVVEDRDGNNPGDLITEEQAELLATKLDEAEADVPAFCKFFKIEKFGDLPAAKYSNALRMIEQRKKKAASND
jgi:hypothetical protein